ncbi:MAG: TolC family protein [Candidatus Caenarcaniphilales bacterium]|nr:TolC family protein [Candidatus Caenarcaniphilales bacterium]
MIRLYKLSITLFTLFCGAGVSYDARAEAEEELNTESMAVLSLDHVFELIDENHPLLRSTILNRKIARSQELEAYSAFVPSLRQRSYLESYRDEDQKRKDGFTFTGEASWQTPFAVELVGTARATTIGRLSENSLGYPSTKAYFDGVKKTKINGFSDGDIAFGIRLPLFRGLWIDEFRADLRKSRFANQLAETQIREKRAELFQKAADKYWEWVGSGKKLEVSEQLLKLAEVRMQGIRDRVLYGANPAIDEVEAESQIKVRQEGLAKALREFQKESYGLSLFVWQNYNQLKLPNRSELPHLIPEPISIPAQIWQDHLAISILKRPELLQLDALAKQQRIDLSLARNEILPRIDLQILPRQDLYGFQGGTAIYGAITAELPLIPLKAQSKVLKAEANIDKNALSRTFNQQEIRTQISDALSQIETSRERVIQSREAFVKLEELAEGERTRFEFGGSSLLNINLREIAAADSQNRLIDALVDHQKGLAYYRYAIGEWSIPGFDAGWYQGLIAISSPQSSQPLLIKPASGAP